MKKYPSILLLLFCCATVHAQCGPSTNTGTCSIDAQNSSTGGTGTTLTGQTLTLSGDDVVFQNIAWQPTGTECTSFGAALIIRRAHFEFRKKT
jgi:hypothetical protein